MTPALNPTASGAPRCTELASLSRGPRARAARGNQSPKPRAMPSPTPSSLAPGCVCPYGALSSAVADPLGSADHIRSFIPALGSNFTEQRCERGSCCIFHARMPTQPPELSAGPVIVGIKHFVLRSHPCRAPYRPSPRDDAELLTKEHTGAPGLGGLQEQRLRAEFGEYPGREAQQEMGRAPEIG